MFNNTFVTRPLFSWLKIMTNYLRLSGTSPMYIWWWLDLDYEFVISSWINIFTSSTFSFNAIISLKSVEIRSRMKMEEIENSAMNDATPTNNHRGCSGHSSETIGWRYWKRNDVLKSWVFFAQNYSLLEYVNKVNLLFVYFNHV